MKSILKKLCFVVCAALVGAFLSVYYGNINIGLVFIAVAIVFVTVLFKLLNDELLKEKEEKRKAKLCIEDTLTKMKRQAEDSMIKEEELKKQSKDDVLKFYSMVSHSMRIPISIISGYADILMEDFVTDDAVRKEYLKKICNRVDYMNEVLGMLLIESRSENQIPAAVIEQFDIVDLLKKMADDVSVAATGIYVAIKVVCATESVFVSGDITQLTKIFYNILENSLKYMGRAGSINITISDLDDKIMLIFKDDGIGIEASEAEKIFELNFQGKNKKSGNGLGLYMAKVTILAHGGQIYAKSGIENGMGIYITLPKIKNK